MVCENLITDCSVKNLAFCNQFCQSQSAMQYLEISNYRFGFFIELITFVHSDEEKRSCNADKNE